VTSLISTIPSELEIVSLAARAQAHMRPSQLPSAVVARSFLSAIECDNIIDEMSVREGYEHDGCGAFTKEAAYPLPESSSLQIVKRAARNLNEYYWNFELDEEPAAWMQTYHAGGSYPRHTDAEPGQSRKLTAVVMLTDHADYGGGSLLIKADPKEYVVSNRRGTIVVFPSWLPHSVDSVTRGIRQTINMGFWGPPFT